MALSIKQIIFAEEYAKTGSREKARLKAEVSLKTSARYRNNPEINEYIKKLIDEAKSENVADVQEILEHLTKIMRGDVTEEVVVIEGQGDGISYARIIDKKVSIKDRLRAAELLGKKYSMFVDKKEVEEKIQTVVFGENELQD